jgi:hypothetical protein
MEKGEKIDRKNIPNSTEYRGVFLVFRKNEVYFGHFGQEWGVFWELSL